VPNCAIVGYTNVGKSSLLHRLTGADVLVENKLFATLDTTTRKVSLPSKQPLLLTDTVGFVRKLPHRLVEAFKATLEEAAQADFLVHLLDASAPEVMEFYSTTMKVLAELHADTRPMIVVFNKTDKVSDSNILHRLRTHFPDALFISVHTGEGLDALLKEMSELASPGTLTRKLRIPPNEAGLIARLHRETQVHEITYDGADTLLTVTIPSRLTRDCARFMQGDEGPDDSTSAPMPSGNVHRCKTDGNSPK
jgi:GTP-binding protein HflX